MDALARDAVLAVVGFAAGVAVGGGFVAFLVVLDVIPRLAQVTRSPGFIRQYQGAIVFGSVFWSIVDLFGIKASLPKIASALAGAFSGLFVGMLAAALTEVLNVLPILAKRIGMADRLHELLLALVLGKVVGSLLEWLVYVNA